MLKNIPLAYAALSLLAFPRQSHAITPGGIEQVGSTLVSAMMMFLGSQDKVYILDKVEGNPTQINGHSAYAVEWDIATNTATTMDVVTNPFCASGMHFPNGSFVTFGGNGAIGPGGNIGSQTADGTGFYDQTYKDYDGERAVRILNPCKLGDPSSQCQWYDNSTFMQRRRWYSAAEPLADGSVVIVGGYTHGGFINRNYPNTDPAYEGGAAEPTYEFYPPRNGYTPQVMTFMVNTSGLNSYALLYLMPSGKMFAQANYSTILWDYNANVETGLPDMPGQIARVYPASGANAMLPLTPANNYTPTVLFCGGQFIEDADWGNYSWPFINTWEKPASKDCQRITPEPADGSSPEYEQDDDLIDGRTMGQFIMLPDQTMLIVNGGANGTAGYSTQTLLTTSYADMPYGMSLAAEPVLTPALYNPSAPKGSRWSNAGLGTSQIPRLYHSSALLLPDASVLIAGSNPNVDYNGSTYFSTEYRAERFYPFYFASTRPVPSGVPTTLTYGGDPFDLTLDKASYSGDANAAAHNTTVVLIRPGFTTHAMNMGQRLLQLNNTYTVGDDGKITLHVAQVPPNPNILTPGPVLLFVVVSGIPSNGTMVTVGNGQIGTQPTNAASVLPASVNSTTTNVGSGGAGGNGTGNGTNSGGGGNNGNDNSSSSSSPSSGVIIGAAVGGAVVLVVLGTLLFCCARRRGKNGAQSNVGRAGAGALGVPGMSYKDPEGRNSDAFIPLQQYNNSAWNVGGSPNQSRSDLHAPQPYSDDPSGGRASGLYDDYYDSPVQPAQHNQAYPGGRPS